MDREQSEAGVLLTRATIQPKSHPLEFFKKPMPQVKILIGARIKVCSFTDGVRVSGPKFRETEADVLAYALWLERHGAPEQAEEYLEEYLQRNSADTCL